jgi:hypothetical protein
MGLRRQFDPDEKVDTITRPATKSGRGSETDEGGDGDILVE